MFEPYQLPSRNIYLRYSIHWLFNKTFYFQSILRQQFLTIYSEHMQGVPEKTHMICFEQFAVESRCLHEYAWQRLPSTNRQKIM